MLSKKNSSKNTWNNMRTWNYVIPPSRPDKWQLDSVEIYLRKLKKSSNIAVLGSTIEFRDLLAANGFKNVYVFEKNRSYFYCSEDFRAYKSRENLVWGDWLKTIDSYSGYFDIVLSDLTSGNIEYEKRQSFYTSIYRSMKNKGLFIDRILIKNRPFKEVEALVKKYSKLPVNLKTANEFNCEMLFSSTLLINKNNVVDTSRFYNTLKKIKNRKILKFVDLCQLITPTKCTWWYGVGWDKERLTYEKFFDCIRSFNEPKTSPYYQRCKLLINKKRLQQ